MADGSANLEDWSGVAMTMLEHALAYAAKRIPVFPCEAGGKKPACPNGFKDATIDPARIRELWSDQNYNIGLCPEDAGLAVVDLDVKRGHRGLESWQVLGINVATHTVETPSGGRHIYFKGSLPPTVSKLGDGIDTRGIGSYVLLPPSVIDGKPYVVIDDHEPASLPDAIKAKLLTETKQSTSARSGEPLSLEQLRAIAAYLEPDAARDEWRNNVAAIRAAPIPEDDDESERRKIALRYSRGELDRRSRYMVEKPLRYTGDADVDAVFNSMPPKDGGVTVGTIIDRARAAGYRGPISIAEAEAYERLKARAEALAGSGQPTRIRFSEIRAKPPALPVRELVPGLIERGIATFLVGAGGNHKSRLAIQFGLCIDSGAPIFGRTVERATFVYLSYEDHTDEVTRRVQKIAQRLSLPPNEAGEHWDLTVDPRPLASVKETGECELQPFGDELRRTLLAIPGHKFIVADSAYNLLRFEGQAKINESAVKTAIEYLNRLCRETDSTMLVLWHPSQAGQDRGDMSGWSVAWHNTPRAKLSISADKDTEDAFELKVEKRNNGPKGKPITLHWSDGVLLPRSENDTVEEVSKFIAACVRVAIAAAEQGAPIQMQRRLLGWQVTEIERFIGRRPTEREVKEALGSALPRGLLRYVRGSQHRVAGYYPPDPERAAELAHNAKRSMAKEAGDDAK